MARITRDLGDLKYDSLAGEALKVTTDGNYIYVAKAHVGVLQSTPKWQVMRVDTTSDILITWADGDNEYDNLATDLTSLNYV